MVASGGAGVLIRQRLWYAERREGWACVQGPDQECLLMLFTSQEGAREFVGPTDAPGGDLPLALLFSEDESEFQRLSRDALLEGIQGALIVADADEPSQTLVRFAVDAAGGAEAAQSRSSARRSKGEGR